MKKFNGWIRLFPLLITVSFITVCGFSHETQAQKLKNIKLITLDPGHFHAALVQKSMYPEVDSTVYVYAPAGMELQNHLRLIDKYNTRSQDPTAWKQQVYTGEDFLNRMIEEKAGNVVVIAGNNNKKTEYIKQSLDAGFNVLADKPLAIDAKGFRLLEEAFSIAQKKNLLLYDIMTERFEINSILQKELSALRELFGTLQKGSVDEPAVVKESVHHFFKEVSGQPLIRPAWFFDVEQQGNGLVDITTHLVDLIQWVCFPNITLDYKKDISITDAERWPTPLSGQQFNIVTKSDSFPGYLRKYIKDGKLNVYSNGRINYQIKGAHARVSVAWNFEAPEGAGDTHFSLMRGSKANLIIRQGKEQNYQPVLYIEPVDSADELPFEKLLRKSINDLQAKYPGLDLQKSGNSWQVVIPEKLKVGHEDHFAQVTRKYIEYLLKGGLPKWEVPNMLAKYYTTTTALEKAQSR
jgi:predicted dehydrogenase